MGCLEAVQRTVQPYDRAREPEPVLAVLPPEVLNPLFTAESGAEYTVDGVAAAAVPEPGTMILLGSGVVALLAKRRNKRSC